MEREQKGGLFGFGGPDITSLAKDIKGLAASIPQAKEEIIERVQQEVDSRVSAALAQAGLSSGYSNGQQQSSSEEYLEQVYEGGGNQNEYNEINEIHENQNENSPLLSEKDTTNDYEFNDPTEEEFSEYVGGRHPAAASKSTRRRPYSLTKKISSVTIKGMASHKSTRKSSRKSSRKAERKGSRKAERKGSRKSGRKGSRKSGRKGSRRNNGGYGGM